MRRGNVLNLWNAVWHHCFARGFGTEGTEKFEVLSMFSYIELQASEKYLWTCILNEKPTLATALINNFVRYCHRRRQDIDVYYRFPRWKRLRGKFGHTGRMKCQLGKYYVVVVTTWFFVKKKIKEKEQQIWEHKDRTHRQRTRISLELVLNSGILSSHALDRSCPRTSIIESTGYEARESNWNSTKYSNRNGYPT